MGRTDTLESSSADGWRISKKVVLASIVSAALTCVAVGIIVYYAGVAQFKCGDVTSDFSGSSQTQKPTTEEHASAKPSSQVTDIRLPGHLLPEKYQIELVPFIIPGNFTIRGKVILSMKCTSPGKNITLHVADLDVNKNSVQVTHQETGRIVSLVEHVFDESREFYIVNLGEELAPGGNYKIQIEFTAKLSDSLKGFYRSVYKDKTSGKEEYIAITQFQATDARRAFPCMDEPALKARFQVSLGRLPEMTSISNMPIKEIGAPMEGSNEYVWDHYEESVPMSTYLVAFVVSKFEHKVAPKTDNDVMFRIWARKDAIDQVNYASEIGPKILRFFEKFFDVPYPLPKQDMLAVQDFSAGAMENWGLITYRETALLFKTGVSALSNKQNVATVISHELAHQWFGNLVTPYWWTDLWLNEGFASYIEYLGVEAVQPELKILEQFVLMETQSVFKIDALESSHPISIVVGHPDEINEIFDRISYAKGAAILRMMDNFLTRSTFQKGLSNFLNAFRYKAAEQDDLWHYLTLQAHKDGILPETVTVKTIMDTWTLQTGYPVITVARDYDNRVAKVSQKRFFVADKSDNTRWWIPITHVTPGGDFNNTRSSTWMTSSEENIQLEEMPDKDTPVIFNVLQTGYYRVNYDIRNWELLIKTLRTNHESIHVTNRAQIIDDALSLARSGLLSYDIALSVTSYLHKETEYVPWSAALDNLNFIESMLKRSGAFGEFKKYMRKLITPLLQQVGYDLKPGDQPLDVKLRKLAVGWACSVGIEDCVDKVKDQFFNWMAQSNPDLESSNNIDVDMRSTVYCSAMKSGGEEEWNFGWQRYLASNVASEKSALLSALACTKEIWMLNRFLNWSLTDGSGVRKADARSVISRIASNNAGADLTFDFIRDNWDRVVEYFGSTSFALSGLMKNVLKDRNTVFALNELKTFQKEHHDSLSSAKREVSQAIEAAEANVKWMENNYQVIWDWLKISDESSVY